MPKDLALRSLARALASSAPMLAGTVREQSITCGNPNCACMAQANPRKHTCHKLTYTEGGRTRGVTLRKPEVGLATRMTESYRTVRRLTLAAGHEVAALVREHGVAKAETMAVAIMRSADSCAPVAARADSTKLRAMTASRDKWRVKALDRQAQLGGDRIRIRDLAASRDAWKRKAMAASRECQFMMRAMAQAQTPPKSPAGHKKKRR
jgi:hypothetical protein